MGFAQYGKNFGALIQAVNVIGSLFYGGLLGVFVLAFFFRSVGANGAFFGVSAGEAAIFAANLFTNISFLWYNVIGCVVVILVGVAVSRIFSNRRPAHAISETLLIARANPGERSSVVQPRLVVVCPLERIGRRIGGLES